MANLTNALQQLRAERSRAQLEVEKLDQAITVIESLNGTGASRKSARPTRVVSAASRRKMALAQRARWARAGNGSQPAKAVTGSAPVKRTMSAPTRRKIAAAQRVQPRNGGGDEGFGVKFSSQQSPMFVRNPAPSPASPRA